MKKQSIVARHPDQLTVAWAQKVVNQHDANIKVTRIKQVSVDVGTTTRVRLHVTHDNPGLLPQQWFVKLPSLAWQARIITALPGLLSTEVRFYNQMSASVPLNKPFCLAAQSQFGRGATLVLADLQVAGFASGHPLQALSFQQAVSVINKLAGFHAAYWHNAHQYQWLAGPVRKLEDFLGTALAVPLMRRGLQLAGELIPVSLHKNALRYAHNRRQVMRYLSNAPQTLVHHDCHPGNLFWQGMEPGFLDWQLVRLGEGVSDVAYFLATSLLPEDRCRYEAELLDRYYQALIALNIPCGDKAELWRRYRAHLVYPFEAMVVTLAVGGMMALESNKELIRRSAAAVAELDAFTAIPL